MWDSRISSLKNSSGDSNVQAKLKCEKYCSEYSFSWFKRSYPNLSFTIPDAVFQIILRSAEKFPKYWTKTSFESTFTKWAHCNNQCPLEHSLKPSTRLTAFSNLSHLNHSPSLVSWGTGSRTRDGYQKPLLLKSQGGRIHDSACADSAKEG